MHLVIFGLLPQNVRVGSPELLLVEGVSETLASLGDFLFYLLLDFAEIVLDQVIGAIAFFGVFVVDERIVESGHMAGSDPSLRVHEHARIYTHDILVEAGHSLPPVTFDVILKLNTHLAIVIDGRQSIVNLAGREDESVFLAVCDKHLEEFVLCHFRYILFFVFFRSRK